MRKDAEMKWRGILRNYELAKKWSNFH